MKDKEELKSCPFCGGEARRGKSSPQDPYIWCTKCHINTGMRFSYKSAIEAWNTRPEGEPRSLSREESANIIHKILFGDDMSESKPILNLEIYALADALIKAEEEKKI